MGNNWNLYHFETGRVLLFFFSFRINGTNSTDLKGYFTRFPDRFHCSTHEIRVFRLMFQIKPTVSAWLLRMCVHNVSVIQLNCPFKI